MILLSLGGEPAGLSMAIYSALMAMKTLILEGQWFGGRAATVPDV